jgi:hypothetical protein
MKKLLLLLMMLFPVIVFCKEPVKSPWARTYSHKLVTFQSNHSIRKSFKYEHNKKAKSIKRMQRQWGTFRNKR